MQSDVCIAIHANPPTIPREEQYWIFRREGFCECGISIGDQLRIFGQD
jgi:hypothetical protein